MDMPVVSVFELVELDLEVNINAIDAGNSKQMRTGLLMNCFRHHHHCFRHFHRPSTPRWR